MKRYVVVAKVWDASGSSLVTVKDNHSDASDFRRMEGGFTVPSGARSAARRALSGSEWSRFERIVHLGEHVGYRFTVYRTPF